MISVLRLAPMRKERLWTSSGSTVRISIRNVMELTSLLYLRRKKERETKRERGARRVGGETAAVGYEKISMKEMYFKLNVTSNIPSH